MADSVLKLEGVAFQRICTMDSIKFPVGEKLFAGTTRAINCMNFDALMIGKTPTKILQCNFYNLTDKKQLTADLFHPRVDFAKYLNDYQLVACSLQNM